MFAALNGAKDSFEASSLKCPLLNGGHFAKK
jgi:hypothetical protein